MKRAESCFPCYDGVSFGQTQGEEAGRPGMADTDNMPDITQTELEQLIGHDASSIAEAEKTVVGEHSAHAHRPRVQNAFVAKVAERGMTVDELDLFAYENLAKDWK